MTQLTVQADPLIAFGQALRSWRDKRGVSQARLASLIPVHRDLISKIENGRRWPGHGLIRKADSYLDADGDLCSWWPVLEAARTARRGVIVHLAAGVPLLPKAANMITGSQVTRASSTSVPGHVICMTSPRGAAGSSDVEPAAGMGLAERPDDIVVVVRGEARAWLAAALARGNSVRLVFQEHDGMFGASS